MSNFPRQCSGLNVCDAADRSTTTLLWGPYAAGYCASVTNCLSQGERSLPASSWWIRLRTRTF